MPEISSFVQSLESRRLLSGTASTAGPTPAMQSSSIAATLSAAPLPRVFSIDPAALAKTKADLAAGRTALQPALQALLSRANGALKMAPVSVTGKTNPSGISAHDYVSYARYYWPNPNTANGLPYVSHDGKVNQTQVDKGDDPNFSRLLSAVNNLAMAYYLTGATSYATHAVQLIEVWFLNPATKMNPNLNHAQIQLGKNTGTFYGIIDSRNMYELVDSLGLLSGSSAWTSADQAGMKSWIGSYANWLRTSSFGKSEAAAANNHATWYDVQEMALLLYLGQTSTARTLAESFGPKRISAEVKSDGSQPLELSRADGWGYSLFNLEAMVAMANLSQRVGVNVWGYKTSTGGSIQKALNYLAPYANSTTPWPHNHVNTPLSQSDRNNLVPLLLTGEKVYGGYSKWLNLLPASTVAASETHLFING